MLGRPRSVPLETATRIRVERESGLTLTSIARRLNEEGIPTARGGARWYPSTVRAIARQSEMAT